MKKIGSLIIVFLFFSLRSMAAVVYVDSAHVGGTQNGTSWATAFSNFQNGINAANAGDSVWVVKGTYMPQTDSSFRMKDSVQIYGGFLNTYTSFIQRDFQSNITTLKGNGNSVIRNESVITSMSYITVLNGFTITGGLAIKGGGMYNSNSSPVISDCVFSYNQCDSAGGGIYNTGSSPKITTCVFSNNEILDSSYSATGGAICNIASSPLIGGCTFSGNKAAGGNGGAVYIDFVSSPLILNCNFSGNRANSGGGIYISGGNTLVNIDGCNFTGNIAADSLGGGGAILNAGTLGLFKCNFVNNNATFGGALYNSSDFNNIELNKIYNCNFHENYAVNGGAIYNNTGSSIIANTLICKNEADSNGSAIFNSMNDVVCRINNCTLVGNWSSFAANVIDNENAASTKITNSIIWGNNNLGLSYHTANSNNISYSLVQGIAADNVNHNIDGSQNPYFIDTAANNYQLLPISTCINVGINDSIPLGITKDLSDSSRVYNITVDMGAFENQFPTLSFLHDTIVCSNQPITLSAQNDNSTYLWSTGDTTQTLNTNMSGVYYVTVSNSLGIISDTFNLIINPAPIVNLGNDSTIQQGASLTLDAGNSGASYLWNTGANTQTITVNSDGIYSVVVTNTSGCSGVDSILINVNPLGIGTINSTENNITIAPNPAKGILHINFDDPKLLHTKATLTDAYGRTIGSVMLDSKSQQFSMAEFASGVYILKTITGQSIKIIKQ